MKQIISIQFQKLLFSTNIALFAFSLELLSVGNKEQAVLSFLDTYIQIHSL